MKCDPIGRHVSVLIFEGLQHPQVIEANTHDQRLYWYDIVKQTIERSGYDGNDRSVMFQSPHNIAGFKPITVSIYIITDYFTYRWFSHCFIQFGYIRLLFQQDEWLVYFVDKSIFLLINSTLHQIPVSNTSGQWKHIYVQDNNGTRGIKFIKETSINMHFNSTCTPSTTNQYKLLCHNFSKLCWRKRVVNSGIESRYPLQVISSYIHLHIFIKIAALNTTVTIFVSYARMK